MEEKKEDNINYLSIADYANKYSKSISAIRNAIKKKVGGIKTTFKVSKGRKILHIEDRDYSQLSTDVVLEKADKGAILEVRSEVTLLRNLQLALGGTTSDTKWTNPNGSVPNPLDIDTLKANMFIDTVVLAIPISIYVDTTFADTTDINYNPDVKSYKLTSESGKRVNEIGISLFNSVGELENLFVSDVLYKDFTPKDVLNCNFYPMVGFNEKAVGKEVKAGSYFGFQILRCSCCNLPKQALLETLEEIKQGKRTCDNLPLVLLKIDTTNNVSGAVKEDLYPPQIESLEIKDNKNYVGQCCHTYIGAMDDSNRQEPRKLSTEAIPFHSVALESCKEILKTINPSEYVGKITSIWEATPSQIKRGATYLESKIYDKFRFHLEVPSVQKTMGTSLHHILLSDQENIEKAGKENLLKGMGRVETRQVGKGVYLPNNLVEQFHLDACKVFSHNLLRITPLAYSLDAFLDTVKATVSIIVPTEKEREYSLYIAHWANGLTGKVNGTTNKGISLERCYEIVVHTTNRDVPHFCFLLKTPTNDSIIEARKANEVTTVPDSHKLDSSMYEDKRRGFRYYQVVERKVFFTSTAGKANLLIVPQSGISTSKLVGLSFASKGLPNMPFEPFAVNGKARLEYETKDLSISTKSFLSFPSQVKASYRVKALKANLSMATIDHYIKDVDFTKAKTPPHKATINGVVASVDGKYFLITSRGACYILHAGIKEIQEKVGRVVTYRRPPKGFKATHQHISLIDAV